MPRKWPKSSLDAITLQRAPRRGHAFDIVHLNASFLDEICSGAGRYGMGANPVESKFIYFLGML
jgi:hypothetical protein